MDQWILSQKYLNEISEVLIFVNLIWIIVGIIVGYFIFINICLMIGSPFYGYLSEKTLDRFNYKYEDRTRNVISSIVFDVKRSIGFEVKKILLSILFFLITFVLNFIPIFGTGFFMLLNLIFSVFTTNLDFFDPGLERFRLKFRTKIRFVLKHYYATIPFGLIALFFVSLPIVNIFAMPVLTVAACKLYIEINSKQ
jgi:CysZ protein